MIIQYIKTTSGRSLKSWGTRYWVSYDSLVAHMVKNLPVMWETQVRSLGWEDPLEKEMAVHSNILGGKPHGHGTLVIYSPWGRKETDTTERLHFHNSLALPLFQFETSWLFHVRF